MNAGDIKVGLTLDNDKFKIEISEGKRLIKQFQKDLDETAKSVKRIEDHTGSFSARVRYAITSISLARGALANLNDIFLGLPRAVANASGEIERMQKLMEGLAKSSREVAEGMTSASKQAREWTGYVFQLAKSSPFDVNALTDAFVKLRVAGLDPTDGSLKALVDSVAKYGGSSEMLKRASVAIQQMGGKGVISMEELRQQLGEAVPDAIQLMAAGVGMSMADLVKKISLGQVESQSALDRMLTMMRIMNNGASEEMMNTWTGQLSQLRTQFTIFLNDVGNAGKTFDESGLVTGDDSFFGEIKKQLKDINEYLKTPEVKRFGQQLGLSLAAGTRFVANAVKTFAEFGEEIKTTAKILAVFYATFKAASIIQSATDKMKIMWETANKFAAAREAERVNAINAEIRHNNVLLAEKAAYLAKLNEMEESFRKATIARRAEMTAIERRQGYIGTLSQRYRSAADDVAVTSTAARQLAIEADAVRVAERDIKRLNEQKQKLLTNAGSLIGRLPILGGVINALGGPIGIITTALTIGAMAWYEWGRQAKEAIDNANRNIRNGEATNADVLTKTGQAKAQESVVNEIQRRIDQVKSGVIAEGEVVVSLTKAQQDARLRGLDKELADAKAKLQKFRDDVAAATKQARDNGIQEAVRLNQKYNDVELNKSRERQNQLIAAENAGFTIRKEQLLKEGKAIEAETAEHNKRLYTIAQNGSKERIAYLDRSIQLVIDKTKSANAKDLEAYQRQVANLISIRNNEIANLDSENNLGTVNLLGGKGGSKKEGSSYNKSPLEKFMDEMKAVNDQLDDGIPKVESYKTKLKSLLDSGKLNSKVSGAPSEQELKTAREFAENLDAAISRSDKAKDYATFIGGIKERIAALNAELSKDATGTVSKLLMGAEREGRFDPAQIEEAKRLIEQLNTSQLASDAFGVVNSGKQSLAGMREELNGGATAAGRLESQLEKLRERLQAIANVDSEEYKKVLDQLAEGEKTLSEIRETASAKDIRDFSIMTKRRLSEAAQVGATEAEIVRARYQIERDELEATYAKMKFVGDDMMKAEKMKAEQMAAINRRMTFDLMSPAERMVKMWEKATDRMKEASADWTRQTIDEMVEMTTTGKFNFNSLAESILKDMLRISYQKQFGGMIQSAYDGLATMVGGAIQGGKSGSSGSTGGFMDSIMTIFNPAAKSSKEASDSINKMKDASAGMGAKIAENAVQTGVQTAQSVTAAGAIGTMTAAATTAAAALAQLAASAQASAASETASSFTDSLGSLFSFLPGVGGKSAGGSNVSPGISLAGFSPFANGGIMTSFGSIQLRKYAKGGIARSPQLALYGEGSMPEAYVPLPDGRRIPVAMTGGGSGVTVNVINAPAGTEVKETRNKDGSISIDVIIEQVEGKISKNVATGRGNLSKTLEKTYGLNRAAGGY